MLLEGAPVIAHLTDELVRYIADNHLQGKYVELFLLSDDIPSEVYVGLKAKKAQELGLYADIKLGREWSTIEVIDEIQQCNLDDACVGIMVQLPVADHLVGDQRRILDTIVPHKDVDGLGSHLFGLAGFGAIDFLPATPKAALEILKYYDLDDVRGKTITIIGRSNLIGMPLAVELIKRGATVISCNSKTDKAFLQQSLVASDYIMSATGRKHLINKDLLDTNLEEKILIDIGRGSDENGPHGDIDWEYYKDKVKAVTPVPGGVGPVTVISLFHNIKIIGEQLEKLSC